MTGVRLPTPAYEAANGWSLAPLQALQLADQSWTPNAGAISFDVGQNHTSSSTGAGYSVAFTENGLLEIALQASLSVNRALNFYAYYLPAPVNTSTNTLQNNSFQIYMPYSLSVGTAVSGLVAGQTVYVVNQNKSAGSFQVSANPGGSPIQLGPGTPTFLLLTQEPGPGYYNVTVTLDANTKAVMVLEDHTIHDFTFNLNIRPNLTADTARFRSGSYTDQTVALLNGDRTSSYYSGGSTIRALGSQYEPNNQGQTGHYWMLYNSAGAASSNAVGIFLGKGSLQYYGEYPHGPGVFDTPSTGSQGFTLWDQEPAPTQNYYTGETKKSWAFWASTKADVLNPALIQPIDVIRDSLAGINLTKVNSYDLSFPDPTGGWSELYESNSALNTLTSLLSNGTSVCGSPNCLYDAVQGDGVQQPLADLLRDDTTPRISSSLNALTAQLQSFANTFYNQMGNLDPTIAYYLGRVSVCPLLLDGRSDLDKFRSHLLAKTTSQTFPRLLRGFPLGSRFLFFRSKREWRTWKCSKCNSFSRKRSLRRICQPIPPCSRKFSNRCTALKPGLLWQASTLTGLATPLGTTRGRDRSGSLRLAQSGRHRPTEHRQFSASGFIWRVGVYERRHPAGSALRKVAHVYFRWR